MTIRIYKDIYYDYNKQEPVDKPDKVIEDVIEWDVIKDEVLVIKQKNKTTFFMMSKAMYIEVEQDEEGRFLLDV